jgi:hypothetical protein
MADRVRFDHAVGRYVHLDLGGVAHRVYFEESSSGIPLLLQHRPARTDGSGATCWKTTNCAASFG